MNFLVPMGGLAAVFMTVSGSATAEQQPAQASARKLIEEVVVIAHPLSGEGLAQASDVLQGAELQRKLAANIGATLARQPGIHSASFGSAVGRPVIHGLGGPRVRIMEARIDALDVSVTSGDHATMVEPFVAERVEVLKGSAALLYGTGAIGGVVDVHTGRIPHELPDGAVSGGVETRYDNNADGQTTAFKINGAVGQVALHVDATWRDGDDYEIPGFTESAALRAAEALEGGEEGEEEEEEEEEEVRGRLPGSALDTRSFAAGASYIADWGFFGAAVSTMDAEYGLPGGHAHEEEGEEEVEGAEESETPMLELEQRRYDFELGLIDPFLAFTSLNVRLGINDYEHKEIEPNGEVATEFENDAWELRAELVYEQPVWSGALGLQHTERDFSALGEEAFVPPVESSNSGVFWVAERGLGNVDLETGLRVGRVEHDPEAGRSRQFTTYAASVGLVWPVTEAWQFSAIADYSARAPVSEELYSNGPHLATNSFEIGDDSLDNERAASLSATAQYDSERWSLSATAYYTAFADYIFEQGTGAIEDDLPVFEFVQEDARFVGLDLEAELRWLQWSQGDLRLTGQFDVVDARVDVSGDRDLPRIPPLRYGIGLQLNQRFESGELRAAVDYLRVSRQDAVASQEFETPAYNDLRLHVGYDIQVEDATVGVFLNGRNLTDQEQRAHVSFIKEFAPEPGRTIEAGLRVLF
ncbi:MAG: TonB-dependent receptor [Pseudomonadales bacterium]